MYGIFTYIWVIFRANVGKYSIHGAYGYGYMLDIVFFFKPGIPIILVNLGEYGGIRGYIYYGSYGSTCMVIYVLVS